jgi:O-antigen/teichoic acid export membrane protein
VVVALYATLVLATVLAVALALGAGPLISAIYGRDFLDGASALRLLLPGTVLYAGTLVVISGLYSVDRPFTASVAQAVGAVLTVAGLALFLSSGGIRAAAIVSSVAYAAVFVAALLAYRREARLSWRDLVPRRADFSGPAGGDR